MTEAILRLPEVKARTGRRKTAIYQGVRAGTFPAPIKLGPRAVGWLESEIARWVDTRIAASRGGAT